MNHQGSNHNDTGHASEPFCHDDGSLSLAESSIGFGEFAAETATAPPDPDDRTKVRESRFGLRALEGSLKQLTAKSWRGSRHEGMEEATQNGGGGGSIARRMLPAALRTPRTTTPTAASATNSRFEESNIHPNTLSLDEEDSVTPVGAFRVHLNGCAESVDGESCGMWTTDSAATERKAAAAAFNLNTPVNATLVMTDDSEKRGNDDDDNNNNNNNNKTTVMIVQAERVDPKPWYKMHRVHILLTLLLMVLTGGTVGVILTMRDSKSTNSGDSSSTLLREGQPSKDDPEPWRPHGGGSSQPPPPPPPPQDGDGNGGWRPPPPSDGNRPPPPPPAGGNGNGRPPRPERPTQDSDQNQETLDNGRGGGRERGLRTGRSNET